MQSVRHDIIMKQGATWRLEVQLIDEETQEVIPILDGWEGRSQVRSAYAGLVWGEATVEVIHAEGRFIIQFPATALEGLVFRTRVGQYATGVWDIELFDPEDDALVDCPLWGEAKIIPEATKTVVEEG